MQLATCRTCAAFLMIGRDGAPTTDPGTAVGHFCRRYPPIYREIEIEQPVINDRGPMLDAHSRPRMQRVKVPAAGWPITRPDFLCWEYVGSYPMPRSVARDPTWPAHGEHSV